MVSNAEAVVIGAGSFGSSLAYHLAAMGLRDVVLLDRFAVGAQTSPRAAASAAAGATAARPPATGAADVPVTERPEVLVGAAFAGAFLFARILKAVTSDD